MNKADRKMFGFALLICVVCSTLLSAVSASLKEQQTRMVEFDRNRNVLKAFGVDTHGMTPDDVTRVFSERIQEIILDGQTGEVIEGATSATVDPKDLRDKNKLLPLYLWVENGEAQKYAFPISGKGLWSTIYGFLAMEKDLKTIAGVTFYKHGETPGLGGEVEKEWFQNPFEGKRMYDNGQRADFRVIKGGVAARYPDGNPHAVDGISGATVTGNGVARFVNEDFDRYDRYFKTIRGG